MSQARAALVTGGAGGLGLATAEMLLKRGYEVVIADLPGRQIDQAITALREHGPLHAAPVDLSNSDDAADLVPQAIRTVSTGRIDALVNSVGVLHDEPIQTLSHEQWQRTLQLNLNGVFATTRAAGNAMVETGGGAIVLISSVAARSARPHAADYAASKAALLSLNKSAAAAFAPTVRVNAVCPGAIWTPMWEQIIIEREAHGGPGAGQRHLDDVTSRTPLRRLGTPDEIAAAVTFLLSEDSSFITGQAVNVCGGLEMN